LVRVGDHEEGEEGDDGKKTGDKDEDPEVGEVGGSDVKEVGEGAAHRVGKEVAGVDDGEDEGVEGSLDLLGQILQASTMMGMRWISMKTK